MKKYLRLICIPLIIILAAGLIAACGKKEEQAPMPYLMISNDYVITVRQNATDAEQAAAQSVQSALAKKGIDLKIQTDEIDAKNEILIGKTSRPASTECLSGLNAGDFTVKVLGSSAEDYKLVLAAIDDIGIELATFYFTHTYLAGNVMVGNYVTGLTPSADGSLPVVSYQVSIQGLPEGSFSVISPDQSTIHYGSSEGGNFSAMLSTSCAIPVDLSHTYRRGDVNIGNTSLSSYSILYAKEGVRADKNIEAAKYGDTVKIFAELLTKATGIAPTLIEDNGRSQESGNLILFGDTSLKEDDSMYSNRYTPVGAYKVKQDGDKILLGGHNPCSALAAGEALVNAILGATGEIKDLSLSGEKEIVKIGCVGDSITYGSGSDDPSVDSYPVYLQRMLGYDYYVEKYGAPGHSLIETDDPTFLKNAYFDQSVSARLDVVIIMLGTNDCRPTKWADSAHKDWRDPQRTANFLASGQKMIDAYRKENPKIQIIWATSPTVPQDKQYGTDWTARLERYGNPLVRQLANENKCDLIDIFTYSENHLEMFEGSDGLHCKNEGYKVLAEGFYELTRDLLP